MSVEYVAQDQSYFYCNLLCTFNVVFTVYCVYLECFIKKKSDAFDSLATANSFVTFIETVMVQWETNSYCFVIFVWLLFLFINV